MRFIFLILVLFQLLGACSSTTPVAGAGNDKKFVLSSANGLWVATIQMDAKRSVAQVSVAAAKASSSVAAPATVLQTSTPYLAKGEQAWVLNIQGSPRVLQLQDNGLWQLKLDPVPGADPQPLLLQGVEISRQ